MHEGGVAQLWAVARYNFVLPYYIGNVLPAERHCPWAACYTNM